MIFVHSAADAESVEVVDYYSAKNPQLGLNFVSQLAAAFAEIEENPGRWPEDEKGFRKFKLNDFPYLVFYRVLGKHIRVLAISHGARKPGYWEGRAADPM